MRAGLAALFVALAVVALDAQAPRRSSVVGAEERGVVIEQVLGALRDSYVGTDVVRKIEAEIRAHRTSGDYDRFSNPEQFVQALTRDLQAASGDKHLAVEFSAEPVEHDSLDCQFVNVAVLGGNVGYIKFDAFQPPGRCGETAAAAMSLVADCRALIVDIRDNSGGDPIMVAFMASYFFADPVHLDDIHERRTNVTVESWTLPFVPGRKFVGKPVFIVTSSRTFSAAEEFAYDLQMLKRAAIVGERSGGGAHPAVSREIDAHFQVSVPVARYVNPLSRTNWEGKGVQPDVAAREAVAVQAAYRAALETVIGKTTAPKQRAAIERQIQALTAVIDEQP